MRGDRYKDIQAWILKNKGYTIKSCWIAHVKEICGVPMRQATNRISKTRRAQPCPSDKIPVIKRALKHVGII
jgi:hypothetical protein